MTDKERDDALIAEKKKLSDVLEAITRLGTVDPWRDDLLRAAALLRGDEQPKPDRYVVALREVSAEMTTQEPLKDEFIKGDRDKDEWFQAAVAVLREHFPERPVIEVPIQVKAWAEGIGSVIPPTDEVREWIKSLPIGATVRPAVPVFSEEVIKQMVTRFLGWKLPDDFHPDDGISFEPEFNKEWNASQGKPPQRHTPTGTNLFNYTQAEAMVRYILDGAKGGAATSIDVHQRRGIMATCITLALRDYDEWQKDDDYNFIAALERVINHLEPAREVALQEFSQ